jgi:hypothetical protein
MVAFTCGVITCGVIDPALGVCLVHLGGGSLPRAGQQQHFSDRCWHCWPPLYLDARHALPLVGCTTGWLDEARCQDSMDSA